MCVWALGVFEHPIFLSNATIKVMSRTVRSGFMSSWRRQNFWSKTKLSMAIDLSVRVLSSQEPIQCLSDNGERAEHKVGSPEH